jgi:hypothetical protein
MSIAYINRYNEEISFELNNDEVKVTNFSHPVRSGWNTLGTKIDFVDPPGGPWIHVGMGLGVIDPSLKSKKVDAIKFEEDHILLTVSDIK